ncbi:hypothetical protein [Ornithinibacillus bavariensis]|uniref:DUF2178 domain-containing protein n=1 Tax=Ornithinibacillus bavariensis TaxID=545502 RepID=A0A919X4E1_9BACI|nr:hypothetical protein [Ornithinibacillus bavariensis]GIO25671.1 hypothetical protein J43TS3_02820 [Ornithinibacillus bavariensis]
MFSDEFMKNPWILLIFAWLFVALIIGYMYQRRIIKKTYADDERSKYIFNQAKSRSWNFMLIVMLIAMPVVVMFDGVSFSYFFLMAILFLHGITMGVTALYYHFKEN